MAPLQGAVGVCRALRPILRPTDHDGGDPFLWEIIVDNAGVKIFSIVNVQGRCLESSAMNLVPVKLSYEVLLPTNSGP